MNNHNVKIMDSGNRVVKVMRIFFRSSFSALLAFAILGSAQAQTGATVTFYHNDGLGSPVAATNADGDVIWRKTYDPYGREHNSGGSAAASNNIGYTGHRFDNDLDLVYAGARYYDPVIGRFMSVDPVGFQEDSIQSFNKYAYANNNPYRHVDPDGEAATLAWCLGGLIGCGIGVAIAGAAIIHGMNGTDEALQNSSIGSGGGFGGTGSLAGGTGDPCAAGLCDDEGGDDSDHIVLGLDSYGLEHTAARVGGRTLMSDPNFRSTIMNSVNNPNTRFTVSLDGFKGATTQEQIMNAVQNGIARGTSGGHTNWEMAQLYRAGRLPTTNFVRDGKSVPNPFAQGGL
jgi:RHS repeat-associated protein